jgi:hypothetical protein
MNHVGRVLSRKGVAVRSSIFEFPLRGKIRSNSIQKPFHIRYISPRFQEYNANIFNPPIAKQNISILGLGVILCGAFVLFWNEIVESQEKISEKEKIELLFEAVQRAAQNDGAIFIRNGKEYTVEEVVQHMKYKLSFARGVVTTAERFIKYIASRSTITGKPYHIKFANGAVVPAEQWLRDALKNIEKRGRLYGEELAK